MNNEYLDHIIISVKVIIRAGVHILFLMEIFLFLYYDFNKNENRYFDNLPKYQ